jgi:surface polysaccharide O-acyltransferase-like enzyme
VYALYAFLMPLNRNFVSTEGGAIIHEGYNSPLVVMVTFALFCFMRQKGRTNKIIDMISPLCFGIYLIHTLFINFIYKFAKFTPEKYPLIVVIVGTLISTMLLSVLFTWCARKIKIVREYIL